MSFRTGLMTTGALCALLLLSACDSGTQTETTPPETSAEAPETGAVEPATAEDTVWPRDASDLEPDEIVHYGQLPNGMRYAIVENQNPSDSAAVRFRFAVGALYEGDDEQTLSHFLEHLAFNGSENVPEGEMVRILERYGLAFGADTNAGTGLDETVYMLNLPSASDEVVDTALFLMRETADKLLLDEDAIDRERGVVLSEQRFRDTWQRRYGMNYYQFLAPDALFGYRLDDKPEAINTVTREDFLRLYEGYYVPERAFLVVVGDIDKDSLEAKITETFGDWEQPEDAGEDPDLGTIDENRPRSAGFFYDPDVPTIVTLAAVREAANKPDTLDSRREELLRQIGNAVVSRRLSILSRQADAPFLQASADSGDFFNTADVATVQIVTTPDKWDRGLAAAEQELRRAREHGFTQAELQEQVANFRAFLRNAAEQAGTRDNDTLAEGIVNAFGADRVFTDPVEDFALFETHSADITSEAVHEAFIAQWDGVELLAHVANNQAIENPEAAIFAALDASAAVAVEAPEDTGALEFAYTDFGTPGAVAEDGMIEDLDARTVRFENNVLLTVKQTPFEDDVVRVSLRVGSGLVEMPKDQPGLDRIGDTAFIIGGLEAHSFDDLQSLLAGRTVDLDFNVFNDDFGGRYETTPADLDLQLQLLTAYVTAPGYREEGLAQFRQFVDVIYETFDATPQGIYGRDVPRLVRSGDPRFGWPAKDDVQSRTFEEFQAATARAFTSGQIELAIVGDVEPDTAIAAVARTFGALPLRADSEPAFEAERQVSFPAAEAEPVVLRHAGEQNRALALTYWPTDDDSDAQDDRQRELLNEIFDLKLTDKIREEIGATYSPQFVSASSSTYPGYGYFLSYLDVEPSAVDDMFQAVDEIAASMATGGISEDELLRARNPVLERQERLLEENSFWVNLLSEAQTDPARLERFRGEVAGLEAITVDDLTATAQRYLDAASAYRVVILPPVEGAPEDTAEETQE